MECCKYCQINPPCVYVTLKEDRRNECSAVQNEKRMIDKACKCFEDFLRIRSTSNIETTNEIIKQEIKYWSADFRMAMTED